MIEMVVNDTDECANAPATSGAAPFIILPRAGKTGKPGLPWLVFLHGFPAIATNGEELGEVFADYTVIVPSPGRGWFGGD